MCAGTSQLNLHREVKSSDRRPKCIPPSPSQSSAPGTRSYAPPPSGRGPVARDPADGGHGDTSSMRARLTSSHFVGRVGELAELELAWNEAAAGRPLLVLLGGESGVGK